MKLFIKVLFIIIFSVKSYADGISKYISNLIPGEGDTEFSIDLRENNSADFSLLAVREIDKTDSGNIFTQMSLFHTEKNSEDRIVGNLGFGSRSLSEDKTFLTGFNFFMDYDDNKNARTSLGLEARSAVLEFAYNQYFGIDDGVDEKVLDGYEMLLASQIPFMHWADLFLNTYEWKGRDRDDIKGIKMGSEMLLTPNINLELAFDDKDKKGLEDEWYAKIRFIHPARTEPSLKDGFISSVAWKENKDMSGDLLKKVKRNNKIMVEFKGASTISRTD